MSHTLLCDDCPGEGVVGTAVPLLGALFTAAAAQGASVTATSSSGSGSGSGSGGPSTGGSIVFTKQQLDGAGKDKKHAIFPRAFQLRLDYEVCALPAEYFVVLAAPRDAAAAAHLHVSTASIL